MRIKWYDRIKIGQYRPGNVFIISDRFLSIVHGQYIYMIRKRIIIYIYRHVYMVQ